MPFIRRGQIDTGQNPGSGVSNGQPAYHRGIGNPGHPLDVHWFEEDFRLKFWVNASVQHHSACLKTILFSIPSAF
jgi:hypothetical protein